MRLKVAKSDVAGLLRAMIQAGELRKNGIAIDSVLVRIAAEASSHTDAALHAGIFSVRALPLPTCAQSLYQCSRSSVMRCADMVTPSLPLRERDCLFFRRKGKSDLPQYIGTGGPSH